MAAEETAFTVKDWLQRIDAKQDTLDEKIDAVAAKMDRKADDRDLRAVADRVLTLEQINSQRLEMWNKIDKRVEATTEKVADLNESKADRADVGAIWKVMVSALGGSAIAILAWALTVFVR